MRVNAREEEFEAVELFGKPALFTNSRVDATSIPHGLYVYDLRGSDRDPGEPATIEPYAAVNHAGTILTATCVKLPAKTNSRPLKEGLDFLGDTMTLTEYCQKQKITLPPEPQYKLRPASPDEAGIFYALPPEKDTELGAIGHVRMDFGRSGNEFWHTWWPRGDEALNSPEFQEELGKVVDELRASGPLKSLSAMRSYCNDHGGALDSGSSNHGYIIETERYRYCLRCNPMQGDYNAYLTAFDLRVQEMNREKPVIGEVTFASGEQLAYTDPDIYLQVVRDELPYRNTSGFRFKTLSEDPALRKAVDDIVYNLCGEMNPRRVCNYGLTDAGKEQLRNAANPNLPHTYGWFVMSAVNTPNEQLVPGLTLPDALRKYQELDTGNKRIGVTKDEIATVDIVVMLEGEEEFLHDHERLANFKDDPVVAQAVETLHQELDTQMPAQGMTMGGM